MALTSKYTRASKMQHQQIDAMQYYVFIAYARKSYSNKKEGQEK